MRPSVPAGRSPSRSFTASSLIFWALIVVVTFKYIVLLLRADNNGEGGILSLTALVFRSLGKTSPLCWHWA